MAVQTITYGNKNYLNQNADIPATNKVQDTDMNEIKSVVNNNATETSNNTTNIGNLSNLATENKTSIVNSINELKNAEIYSTEEVKTNKIWINGKPIYRKVFNRGNNISSFNHNIANVDLIWIDSTHSIRKHQSGNVFNLIGGTNDSSIKLGIYVNNTEVNINNVGALSPSEIYITLEYTKTTD